MSKNTRKATPPQWPQSVRTVHDTIMACDDSHTAFRRLHQMIKSPPPDIDPAHIRAAVGHLPSGLFWSIVQYAAVHPDKDTSAILRACMPPNTATAPWRTQPSPLWHSHQAAALRLAIDPDDVGPTPLWTTLITPEDDLSNTKTWELAPLWLQLVHTVSSQHLPLLAPLERAMAKSNQPAAAHVEDVVNTSVPLPAHIVDHLISVAQAHPAHVSQERPTWARLCMQAVTAHPNPQTAARVLAIVPAQHEQQVCAAWFDGLVNHEASRPRKPDGPLLSVVGPILCARMANSWHVAEKLLRPRMSAPSAGVNALVHQLAHPDLLGAGPTAMALINTSHCTSAIDKSNLLVPDLISRCSTKEIKKIERALWKTLVSKQNEPRDRRLDITNFLPVWSAVFEMLPKKLKEKWAENTILADTVPAIQAHIITNEISHVSSRVAPRMM